jgi:hypothetical protein
MQIRALPRDEEPASKTRIVSCYVLQAKLGGSPLEQSCRREVEEKSKRMSSNRTQRNNRE